MVVEFINDYIVSDDVFKYNFKIKKGERGRIVQLFNDTNEICTILIGFGRESFFATCYLKDIKPIFNIEEMEKEINKELEKLSDKLEQLNLFKKYFGG